MLLFRKSSLVGNKHHNITYIRFDYKCWATVTKHVKSDKVEDYARLNMFLQFCVSVLKYAILATTCIFDGMLKIFWNQPLHCRVPLSWAVFLTAVTQRILWMSFKWVHVRVWKFTYFHYSVYILHKASKQVFTGSLLFNLPRCMRGDCRIFRQQ
jgi:hypothetical protein